MAAATAACVFPGVSLTFRRHEAMPSTGNLNSNRVPSKAWRLEASVDQVPATSTNSAHRKRRLDQLEKQEEETENVERPLVAAEGRRIGAKDYFEQARDFIKSDGGPPRWFSPLECTSRLNNAPLLLFLPGIDGLGHGLISHQQKLGRIFDIWCLHIPVMDRTPFIDLVKMVETTVRLEHERSPSRPIYLVGDSLGGCLALAIAARNPDIDLVLILANPATSFSKSQLPLLIPLLEATPGPLSSLLPNMFSLIAGDPFGATATLDNLLKGLPLQNTARELTEGLATLSSSLAVLAEILQRETLLWKLHLLKSASAYANSRLHAIKAQTLILSSGKDQFLPSQEEGERLSDILPRCDLRKFDDSGHFLLLEGSMDLVTVIKGTYYYRRGKYNDYASDFIPPTPDEVKYAADKCRNITLEIWETVTSAVILSTLDDGTIVKGLAGIPSEGPVLFVGYHMLMGIDIIPLVPRIYLERNILLRGMAHPVLFTKSKYRGPDLSSFDPLRIMGAVPVAPTNLFRLLSSKSHVLLYPGGMREACHRKGEEYKLFWPEQSEFVRMAARFGAKIVPFGSVGEDDFGQVVIDYDDLTKIPWFRNEIEKVTNGSVRLRDDAVGEVANQQMHVPGILPKFPGRFYYYFGKPIETEGMKEELKDKDKANKVYLQVKSEVENCLAYLKEKREGDPYRNLLPRLFYQATHGLSSQVPTFEI